MAKIVEMLEDRELVPTVTPLDIEALAIEVQSIRGALAHLTEMCSRQLRAVDGDLGGDDQGGVTGLGGAIRTLRESREKLGVAFGCLAQAAGERRIVAQIVGPDGG